MLNDLSIYLIQFVFLLGQLFFPKEAALVSDFVSDIQIEQNASEVLSEETGLVEFLQEDIVFSEEWSADKENAIVSRIVDGDTVELSDGRKLRYIGIDTPESVNPRKEVECFSKEASKANEILVLNKEVWLEKDITDSDRYGRVLRYVYIVDPETKKVIFVNQKLVSQGFAHAYRYEPDTKYYDLFKSLENQAKSTQRGLWSPEACTQ